LIILQWTEGGNFDDEYYEGDEQYQGDEVSGEYDEGSNFAADELPQNIPPEISTSVSYFLESYNVN
jgi:hypothetical protein